MTIQDYQITSTPGHDDDGGAAIFIGNDRNQTSHSTPKNYKIENIKFYNNMADYSSMKGKVEQFRFYQILTLLIK